MKNTDNKKPTLKDVAAKLGVSTATVSNAFNRPDQLSVSLRDKILAQCHELGYTGPSLTARSLRTGKTGVIGVLLADNLAFNFTDPVASQFLAGISSTLDAQHVNMLLLPSEAENYLSTQVETIPDSFIVYGKPKDSSVVERIQRQGKPLVTVDFKLNKTPSVNVDNHKASYEIAKHALRDGPKNVHVLALRLEATQAISLPDFGELYTRDESVSRCRFEGIKQALEEEGIELPNRKVWQVHELEKTTVDTVLRGALTAPEKIDVLLCMSDRIALSALEVAGELGIKVPEELKIVGFDDIPAAEANGLTTVHQPITEKGRIAAQMALGLIPHESIVLPVQIKLRASS
ncbi:LacI family DNA-binding transcriptional regulator [Vibrio sp. JC009]|uniref:LacI family DNA-binding transcriptional regulator n=1 Tax=Vibrio sp. JC009 TaxID=2912314 RepID=UPI0023B206C8|nr:LacI family DNA-binding transcriptional regulator [Vibrio sp. JC009]WED24798.1 LacI family DNA-binding transcriptional regulator [Vibrio sp. JC009]